MKFPTSTRRQRRTRRAAIVTGIAVCSVAGSLLATPVGASERGGQDVGSSAFVSQFRAGTPATGAMFRWWWPSAVDADTAVRQLIAIDRAGYKGVEIAFVMDGTSYEVDPDRFEFGDAGWRAAVRAVLSEANRRDLQVDLTLGGRWPAAVPGLDVDGPSSSKEIVAGSRVVSGGSTYSGPVPAPAPLRYPDRTSVDGVSSTTLKTARQSLTRVSAVRCTASCDSDRPQVDLTSVVDLTGRAASGAVSWSAPAGTWILSGYWSRGTAQRNDAPFGQTVPLLSDPESRVVDHFSTAGSRAIIGFMSDLLDRRTRDLLRRNGGSIFEDSLELKAAQLWTPEFFDAFAQSRGYRAETYLPVLANKPPAGPFSPPTPQFAYSADQAETAQRVRHDIDRTMNELYLRRHVAPVQRWAATLGLDFRAQPYGEPIDLGEAAGRIDRIECESLGCSDQQFRTASTGVAVAGKTFLSSEMLPGGFGNLYNLTPAQVSTLVGREYTLGANQMIFHGLDYPNLPPRADGTRMDTAAQWPGFHAFPSNIGEAFGPRNPSWAFESDISGYYARTQQVLQQGTQQIDVAVLNQQPENDEPDADASDLAAVGYTAGYLTPGSLAAATPSRGALDAGGAGIKAVVVADDAADVATMRRLVRAARGGVRVVVVGDGPTRTLGYASSARRAATQDETVRDLTARLLTEPTVAQVDTADSVPQQLEALAVRPTVRVDDHAVQAVRRTSRGVDLYFLSNRGTETTTTRVAIPSGSSAVPYRLDAWDGEVQPVGTYRRSRGQISTDVTLTPGASTVLAVASRTWTGTRVNRAHVVSTTADDARVTPRGRVEIRASRAGTYRTTLSDGRAVTSRVDGVAAGRSIDTTAFSLEEWLPGDADDASDVTRRVRRDLGTVPLTSWSSLPATADAVGIGTYTASIDLRRLPEGTRAELDLGTVGGAYRVRVNGRPIATPDQTAGRVDLGSSLRAGANRIEVEVASPLLNRLRTTRPAEFGARAKTANGLAGPVDLTFSRTVTR